MPAFSLEKSILIGAPIDTVFAKLRDFKTWPDWSPWIIAEPDCPLTYAEDGKSYGWDGKIIGSGEMAVNDEDPPKSIDYRLSFLKPWKSECTTHFRLVEKDGATQVSWSMNGSLPWFMFWMKPMMIVLVGMDYQRGLLMFKDYVEAGAAPSKLEFKAGQHFGGCRYVGVRKGCAISDIGPEMSQCFEKLGEWLSKSGTAPSGKPFSIYHEWKLVKGSTEFTAAFPVAELPAEVPDGLVTGETAPMESYTVTHTGPYRHLGNAWAAAMMHARAKVFAKNNKVAPLEVYENSPEDTDENDLVTTIHMATK